MLEWFGSGRCQGRMTGESQLSQASHESGIAYVWQPPDVPSKWDVIPIHNSDRSSFKNCRRKWDWSSPARQNLTVRADVYGINVPFFFGTGIHYALESFYTPGLRRDPVEAFKTWFHIMWKGGTVTVDWLSKVYDLAPKAVTPAEWQVVDGNTVLSTIKNQLYRVKGLEEILPDPDHVEFDQLYELGINMMEFYKKYSARVDGFEVVVAEHDFSVPVWDYANERILRMIDLREQSPNYGKELEVHARGRMDGIWIKPNGKLGIIDHKTAEKIDERLDEKLETDEQCSTYLWAAEIEASYYNLPHKGEKMEEVIYNVLRKAAPREPTIVRGGMFSVDRTKESTTYDMLQEWIEEAHIDIDTLSEKHQGYIEYLRTVGDEQFIIRKLVRRNRHQLRNAGFRLYQEAIEMLNPDLSIYPNIRNDWSCLNCQFRAPCMAMEAGYDYQQMINDNYSRTRDR